MPAPTLAFLKVDARRPLDDAVVPLEDASSKGFVKLEAKLSPTFSASTSAYDVVIATKATHVNVMASTLVPGCKISVDGVTGNMATRPASGTIEIVVESATGEKTTYKLTPKTSSDVSNDGEVVMKEKPKVASEPETHGHSHDGVPCDGTHHSHGHSHDDKKAKCEHDHGEGEECHGHGENHGHGHAHHEEKHDHGHGHHEEKHDHGHGHHEEKKHDHGHGHHEEKHDHGHGHCEEKHDHGHGHREEKHDHGHGHH